VAVGQRPFQEQAGDAERHEGQAVGVRAVQRQSHGDGRQGEPDGEQGHGPPGPARRSVPQRAGQRPVVLLARARQHDSQHRQGERQEGRIEPQQTQRAGVEDTQEQERQEVDGTLPVVLSVAMKEEAVDVQAAEVEERAQDQGGQRVEPIGIAVPPLAEPRQDRLGREQDAQDGGVEPSRIAKLRPQDAHRRSEQGRAAGAEGEPAPEGAQQLEVHRAPSQDRNQAGEQEEQRRASGGQAQPPVGDDAESEDAQRPAHQDQELERRRDRRPLRLHEAVDGHAGHHRAGQQQPADAAGGTQPPVGGTGGFEALGGRNRFDHGISLLGSRAGKGNRGAMT
jgi:hypothetical protein